MSNIYKINGKDYRVVCRYDGEMFEAKLCDEEGNSLPFFGYGDKPAEARYELSERLFENDIKAGQDNAFVIWNNLSEELKHKITVIGRGVKMELMGEWYTEAGRFEQWQRCMYNTTKEVYPHKLPRAFYDHL